MVGRLAGLAVLVAQWGQRMNLSGHRTPAGVFDGLVLDAVSLHGAITRLVGQWPERIVDLGAGAGFPGLPFALLDASVIVELVESRRRRHHFQRAACRELAIANALPRLGRIETLSCQPARLVFAQALAPLAEVASLCARWVAPGGCLIVPTGAEPEPIDPGPAWRSAGAVPYGGRAGAPRHSAWYAIRSGVSGDSP